MAQFATRTTYYAGCMTKWSSCSAQQPRVWYFFQYYVIYGSVISVLEAFLVCLAHVLADRLATHNEGHD